jgi:hypothetical protein
VDAADAHQVDPLRYRLRACLFLRHRRHSLRRYLH